MTTLPNDNCPFSYSRLVHYLGVLNIISTEQPKKDDNQQNIRNENMNFKKFVSTINFIEEFK